MDWHKFAEECGPLYPDAMNALTGYKRRVQDSCVQVLSDQVDVLCRLFGWNRHDIAVGPYADPDRLPREAREYFNVGAKLRKGALDQVWLHLHYKGEIGERFTTQAIWFVAEKQAIATQMVMRISAVKEKKFAREPWSVAQESGGFYLAKTLDLNKFGEVLEQVNYIAQQALDVLTECGRIATLIRTPRDNENTLAAST